MNIDGLLRKIIIGGLFLVPVVPLLVSTTMFFPFITSKGFFFRILIEILFALWLILVLRDKSYLPKRTEVFSAFGLFIIVMAVADMFGVNPYKSFWSNYERMEGFVCLIHLFAYFVLISSVFTEKIWKWFFGTFLATGALLVLFGLFQIAGVLTINQGGTRLDATFGNATYFAAHMLFLSFLAAFYFFRDEKGSKWIYGALGASFLFMLYETATRGTMLGLIGGVIVAAGIIAWKGGGGIRKLAKWIIATILLLIVIFACVKDLPAVKNNPVLGRFSTISISSIMKEPRFMVWGMALQGFKENPILGWGQENFNYVFNKYYNPHMWSQEQWFDRAHDVFFDWLIAGGLLGLLAYLYIFFAGFRSLWKERPSKNFSLIDKSILTGLLAGYFLHIFFVFDNLMSYIMFLSLLAFIAYESSEKKEENVISQNNRNESDELLSYILTSLVIVSLVSTVYFLNVKPILSAQNLIRALSNTGSPDALEYIKKALSYNSFGTTEIREQLTQKSVMVRRDVNIDSALKQKYYELAREEIFKQIEWLPLDARYRVFAGSFLSAFGMDNDAIVQLEKALELSPNKQTILYELASVYTNVGNSAKAIEYSKKALELDESNGQAKLMYLATVIYSGNSALEKEIIQKYFDGKLPVEERLINAYAAVKNFKKVIELWKGRIEADPSAYQYHIFLSASYLADGQRSNSIKELEVAKQMVPDLAKTVDPWISEIKAGRNP